MSTSQTLIKMIQDLRVQQRDPNTLLVEYVEERLNKTVDTYYKSVIESARTLERRSTDKVAKGIIKQK